MSSPEPAVGARSPVKIAADGCVAVVNAGSSSVKFAIHGAGGTGPALYRGKIEGVGVAPKLSVVGRDGEVAVQRSWGAADLDVRAATREALLEAADLLHGEAIAGVGHRVVHGGVNFAAPVRVEPSVMAALQALEPLAPLHQPYNLAGIAAVTEAAPNIPQVACFDTAFHRTQPELAQLFGLPESFTAAGVRRYGFHGLSYEYIAAQLKQVAPRLAEGRAIVAHLGNGASLCALDRGRSVATTMGFTAVEGLLMGTRCGSLDPGVVIYLLDQGMSVREVESLVYRKSGLLGVSGVSSDMRRLRASSEPGAAKAIRLFVYRAIREAGALAAVLGGVDGLVFTAGIGENDAATRAEIAAGLEWLGLELDSERNARSHAGRISRDGSRVEAWVIPTDEEAMIARHTAQVLAAG